MRTALSLCVLVLLMPGTGNRHAASQMVRHPGAMPLPEPRSAQQEATDGPRATPGPIEQTIHRTKHPADWLVWGADLRLRNEYYNNAASLSEDGPLSEQDYFRFRARAWATATHAEGAHVDIRLTTEPRLWMKPTASSPYRGHSGVDWTLGIIDALHVGWEHPGGAPFSFCVGRQDLMLAEGWLLMEGTPYDGSWTHFFDAARLTWELEKIDTVVDAIGIVQHARNSAWLPILGNDDRYLTDQDETAAVLNIANRTIREANLDAYAIYKHDRRLDNGMPGDDADLVTVSLRASGELGAHWKYFVDCAYQFGSKNDPTLRYPTGTDGRREVRAFGVNSRLTHLLGGPWNTQLHLSYEFLSGDDPDTGRDEMFDILWGRWPHWSELYNVFSYAPESRLSQAANLHRIGPGFSVAPAKRVEVVGHYYLLFTDERTPTRASAGNEHLFGGGGFRGQFLQGLVRYRLSDHLAAHLWGEILFPGGFYAQHEPLAFLRAELQLTW